MEKLVVEKQKWMDLKFVLHLNIFKIFKLYLHLILKPEREYFPSSDSLPQMPAVARVWPH